MKLLTGGTEDHACILPAGLSAKRKGAGDPHLRPRTTKLWRTGHCSAPLNSERTIFETIKDWQRQNRASRGRMRPTQGHHQNAYPRHKLRHHLVTMPAPGLTKHRQLGRTGAARRQASPTTTLSGQSKGMEQRRLAGRRTRQPILAAAGAITGCGGAGSNQRSNAAETRPGATTDAIAVRGSGSEEKKGRRRQDAAASGGG